MELQYISSGSKYQTKDLAWMVGRCPSDVAGSRNAELCENPDKDDSLETLIPVTEIGSNAHYRNKYCAYCSGITDSAVLVKWKIEIYNEIYLTVPDDNLLQKIRKDRGNIFYKSPDFVAVETCEIPDTYLISRCNVSRKWSVYNESLERACDAFIDPFNHTYQNYFCFLCNSPTLPTSNWSCLIDSQNIENISPPFFALLDISEATGHEEEEKPLACNSNQFSDLKKVTIVCTTKLEFLTKEGKKERKTRKKERKRRKKERKKNLVTKVCCYHFSIKFVKKIKGGSIGSKATTKI